jgi:multicomponent Na+:H+ antiporter subunit E
MIGRTRDGNLWMGIRRGTPRVIFFALLWWALSDGEVLSWIMGVPAVLLSVGASMALKSPSRWHCRLSGLVGFLPFFLWHSLRGAIDVMLRAIKPARPLAPALLNYPLRMADENARIFMANTVSLLPGTLTAELSEKSLTVHALDATLPVEKELRAIESRVAELFGLKL